MILVTGFTGNVGGEVASQLLARGATVRALVRSDKEVSPKQVQIAVGNLNEPESIGPALKGIRRVFLLGGYRDMPGLLAKFRDAGVEHVVLLSSRSVIGGNPSNAIVNMWLNSEDAVRSSGIAWTILRPSGFMSNALRWLPELRSSDTIRAPFANVPIAAIDPGDIAAVASIALTSEDHSGHSYELSGPEALRPSDQIATLGRLLQRPLRMEPVLDNDAMADLRKTFSEPFADAMFRFYAKGEFDDSRVIPTVVKLTGTPPKTFDQWARNHIDEFASHH